jgi:hypothetical protein
MNRRMPRILARYTPALAAAGLLGSVTVPVGTAVQAIPLNFVTHPPAALPIQSNASYAASNSADTLNVQATVPVVGGGQNSANQEVTDAAYNNDFSESYLAVNPDNPANIVGSSKFFFQPPWYLFHVGSYASFDGGATWTGQQVIPGFDPRTAPSNEWTDTTDPVIAFDRSGDLYSAIFPYSFTYNPQNVQVYNVKPNAGVYVVKSADGGKTWTLANGGQPIVLYGQSSGLGLSMDFQRMAIDTNPPATDPFSGNIYITWSQLDSRQEEAFISRSTDGGNTFSQPRQISFPQLSHSAFNPEAFVTVGKDGTVYLTYTQTQTFTFAPHGHRTTANVFLATSSDGGKTFSTPRLVQTFGMFPVGCGQQANTTFRNDCIPATPVASGATGHLFVVEEVWNGTDLDVQLAESADGGASWSAPIKVNDNSPADGTDQFQPMVAVSPDGSTVAVAFYDRRLACPQGDPNILPADQGRPNLCINTTVQFFHDGAAGLVPLGANIRISKSTWDPQDPGSAGLPKPTGPTTTTTFIGDYLGLALTNRAAYVSSVSTYNFGANPPNNQEQIINSVPIPSS